MKLFFDEIDDLFSSEPVKASTKSELKNLKQNDACAFNSRAESEFIEFLHELIRDNGFELSKNLIIREASFELDISPETAKRYLFKHTASRAQFSESSSGMIRSKRHKMMNTK